MIKVKLGTLKNAENSLRTILTAPMPIATSYKLSKVMDKIGEELTRLETTRVELVQKHGEANDSGNLQVTDPDKLQEFHKEYSDLLEAEVSLEIEPIKVTDLGNVQLSAVDIKHLQSFITE